MTWEHAATVLSFLFMRYLFSFRFQKKWVAHDLAFQKKNGSLEKNWWHIPNLWWHCQTATTQDIRHHYILRFHFKVSLAYDRVPKQHCLFVFGLFRPWQRKAQQKTLVFLNNKNTNISGRNFAWNKKKHQLYAIFSILKTSLHLKLKAKVYGKIKKRGSFVRSFKKKAFPNTKKTKRRSYHGFSPSKNPTKKQNPRNFQQDPLNGPLNLGI